LNWETFDISKLSFSEAKKITFGELTYHRIYLSYAYDTEQGGIEHGDLSLETPILMSYGIQENRAKKTMQSDTDKSVDSYTISLRMWDPLVGPTDEEKGTVAMFDSILTAIKEHLKMMETKRELKKFDMDPDVDRMTLYFIPQDEGVPVPDAPPIFILNF